MAEQCSAAQCSAMQRSDRIELDNIVVVLLKEARQLRALPVESGGLTLDELVEKEAVAEYFLVAAAEERPRRQLLQAAHQQAR